mmetsp:Transcript_88979/g.237290  ORF Transcript_88979/g.237290 Transcript_88979/m.237290 type:complete len:217 (+) Transcript_88979:2487-3137(+)
MLPSPCTRATRARLSRAPSCRRTHTAMPIPARAGPGGQAEGQRSASGSGITQGFSARPSRSSPRSRPRPAGKSASRLWSSAHSCSLMSRESVEGSAVSWFRPARSCRSARHPPNASGRLRSIFALTWSSSRRVRRPRLSGRASRRFRPSSSRRRVDPSSPTDSGRAVNRLSRTSSTSREAISPSRDGSLSTALPASTHSHSHVMAPRQGGIRSILL